MKVIRPIAVANDIYTNINSRDIVPVWSNSTAYGESSTFNKVWVSYAGGVYESVKPNNLNNLPNTADSVYWRYVADLAVDDFAFSQWYVDTTYSKGDIIVYQLAPTFLGSTSWPRYYQSLQDGNLNNIPPDNLTGTNPYWLDLGYTNTSKLYDVESSTQTITTDELITTFTSRNATAAGVFNGSGTNVLITAKSERNIYDSTSWTTTGDINTTTPVLNGMCFSADKNVLLICGNAGFLKYSKNNGTSWTSCTVPTADANLKSIAYSKESGVFIIVGTSIGFSTPRIWKSVDGIVWTSVSAISSSSTSLNKVVWIKTLNRFVVAANNGNIYRSVDETGDTWESPTNVGAGSADLVDLVYNPGNGLVHVIGNQVLRYSSDLINWTAISVAGYSLRAIDVRNQYIDDSINEYVYIATNISTGTHYLYYSSNGTSWTQSSLGVDSTNTPISLAYCYTESKWVINCTGVVLAWTSNPLGSMPGAVLPGGVFYVVTPPSFDSSRTKIYYNNSTDTLFLFGNNKTLVTSAVTYFNEYYLNTTLIENWYDEDYNLLSEIVFQNIPTHARTRITVSIIGNIVRCGIVFGGVSTSIGTTQYGASAGIIDYSKKETDEFGTTTFIRRAFSKRMNVNLILPSNDLYKVQKILSDVRATPCVWIGNENEIYRPLVMYGYYRDFNLEIPYPEYSYCSLQIEGLTE